MRKLVTGDTLPGAGTPAFTRARTAAAQYSPAECEIALMGWALDGYKHFMPSPSSQTFRLISIYAQVLILPACWAILFYLPLIISPPSVSIAYDEVRCALAEELPFHDMTSYRTSSKNCCPI